MSCLVRCSGLTVLVAGVATANYMCTTCPLDIFAQVMRGGRRIKVRAVVVSFEYSANGINSQFCVRARGPRFCVGVGGENWIVCLYRSPF